MQTQLPKSVTKYGASAISGFFLLHNTVEDKPVYPTQMKYIFGNTAFDLVPGRTCMCIPRWPTKLRSCRICLSSGLANSTNGVNADCIAAKAEADKWQCNFAQESYAYTKSPTFPLNSGPMTLKTFAQCDDAPYLRTVLCQTWAISNTRWH